MNYRSQTTLTQFSSPQTDLQTYSTTFQQIQPGQQQMLPTYTARRSGTFTIYLNVLPQFSILSLPLSSPSRWTASSTSTYSSPLPTTLKQMDSGNEQSRHTSSISASTSSMHKPADVRGYLLPNLPTMPHLLLSMVTIPTEPCMHSTHAQYTWIIPTNSPPLPLNDVHAK